jgi:hypothetical protein
MALVVLCVVPLVVYRCWRASGPITELMLRDEQFLTLPMPLILAVLACPTAAVWGGELRWCFGDKTALAGLVVWMICSLSVVCYTGAMAAGVDERDGKKPAALLLSWGYNLGGFLGVKLARAAFPESDFLAEVDRKPPFGALFVAAMLIATAFFKLS